VRKGMKEPAPDEGQARVKCSEEIQNNMPEPPAGLQSMADDMAHRSEIHLLARGDYQNKGDGEGMRPLGVLLPEGTPELRQDVEKPRAELAKWVTNPQNPLTARVMVNRICQYHFVKGIVAAPDDFGLMCVRPTHPELLG